MRRLLILTGSLVALLATTASPATAGAGDSHAADPLCASSFDSLSSLTGSGSARATGTREPALLRGGDRETLARASSITGLKNFRATIPVNFHVITDGDDGQVSDATIDAQLTVMNLAFSGFYGGPDTGFRFRLRRVDRTDNAAWFAANPETPEETEMKLALKRGGGDVLNLYTTSGGFYLGWAYYPDIVADPASYLDGVVIDFRSMPGGPYGNAYSLGQTATHEVGHWLALFHTFENGCEVPGDEVHDTPYQLVPTGGCPVGKDTCPAPGVDPIHNYMDYSFDSCYEEFTAGQTQRMQQQYLYWRIRYRGLAA